MELAPGGCEGIFVRRVDSTGDGGEVVAVFQSAGIQTRGKGGGGGVGEGESIRIRPYSIAAAKQSYLGFGQLLV